MDTYIDAFTTEYRVQRADGREEWQVAAAIPAGGGQWFVTTHIESGVEESAERFAFDFHGTAADTRAAAEARAFKLAEGFYR